MNKSKSVKCAFRIIVILITIILFLIHVYGVIEKALEKQTSFTTSQKHFKTLSPPSLTLCPGQFMNIIKLKKLYNITYDPLKPWIEDPKIHQKKPWEVYMNSSYVLNKDIFIGVGTYANNKYTIFYLKLGSNFITEDELHGKISLQ